MSIPPFWGLPRKQDLRSNSALFWTPLLILPPALEQPGEVASSSSFDLRNRSAVPSTSSNPAAQLVFAYDVDEAVLKAMERGKLHEWTQVEFKAICRNHGLSVSRGKGELMQRVRVHLQRLYRL